MEEKKNQPGEGTLMTDWFSQMHRKGLTPYERSSLGSGKLGTALQPGKALEEF